MLYDSELNQSRVISLIAPQKYGKTTIVHYLAEEYSKRVKTFVFDTNFERVSTYGDIHKNIYFLYQVDLTKSKEEFLNESIQYIRSKHYNICIIIEDYDKYCEGGKKSSQNNNMFNLASDSRHQYIALIYTTKTPSYIPTTLRLNTNLTFIGKFPEGDETKSIYSMIPRSAKKEYSTLARPEFLAFDRENQTTTKVRYNININDIEVVG